MVELLAKGKRVDGRSQDETRALKIETRLIEKANGSAKVSLGNTQVIAGVKVATGTPFADTPDKGVLMVNAEVLPLSSPYAEACPPDEHAIERARVVDRGVREAELVDLSKLVLIAGKSVYTVFVDVNILNVDGNLFDATSYAVVSALRTAKMPKFEADGEKVTNTGKLTPLPVQKTPVSITMARIGTIIVVYPTAEEEAVMVDRKTLTHYADEHILHGQLGEAGHLRPAPRLAVVR